MCTPHSHLVGYQNKEISREGWNIVCATFLKVDGSSLTLNDAKKNDAFSWEYNDEIQFLDEGGGTRMREDGFTAEYSYFTEMDGAPADGWYQFFEAFNGNWLPPEEADDFSYGAGAVVQTSDKTAALVFSGEVAKGPQTVVLAKEGWNLVGNPLPIDMTLSDVSKNDAFSWEYNDEIQFLDEGGGTRMREDGFTAEYSYFTEMDGAPADGWYQFFEAFNGNWLAPEDDDNDIKAGRAFVVQSSDRTAALQFKQAIAE